MFDWLGDILSGMGEAVSSSFEAIGEQISTDIWNTMIQWFYETIYGAVADFFSIRVSQTFWTPSEIWDNLPNIIGPSNTDGVITMARNKLVDMIGKLSEEQVERLSEIAMKYLDLNTEVEDTAPKSCPCCGAANAHFIKRGFSGRKQRYQCKSCGKRFTFDAGKLTAYSHQTEEAWATFIRDTLSLKSLDACAANISVSHPTSFYMRHKLLSFLEEALKNGELLEGIVEADEAYVLESQKGIPVSSRKPRKHGESATKRGLSDEQMCICVAADREGRVVARCVNRAKPTAENIRESLGSRIGENSVFLCDGATAYNKLIEEKKCQKIVLNTHKDYNKAYHLNTVNGLHSRLKAMLYRYRGVSSKYLNRYLALFNALEQAGRSVFHPEIDSVRQMIARVNTVRRIRKLSTEAVLAL